MSWQVAIVIGFVAMGIATILQRQLMKKKDVDPIAFAAIFQIIISIPLIAVAFYLQADWSKFFEVWYLLFIAAAFYLVAAVSRYIGLKTEHAAVYSIGLQSRVLWAFIFSIFILQETNTWQEFAGAFLILLAVILLSYKGTKLKIEKGFLYILLSALTGAIAFIFDIFSLRSGINIYLFVGVLFLVGGLMNLAIYPSKIKSAISMLYDRNYLLFYIGTIAYGIASMSFYVAYDLGGTSSAITTLFQLYIPLVVILAVVFLKERENLRSIIIAGILSIIGAILVG